MQRLKTVKNTRSPLAIVNVYEDNSRALSRKSNCSASVVRHRRTDAERCIPRRVELFHEGDSIGRSRNLLPTHLTLDRVTQKGENETESERERSCQFSWLAIFREAIAFSARVRNLFINLPPRKSVYSRLSLRSCCMTFSFMSYKVLSIQTCRRSMNARDL